VTRTQPAAKPFLIWDSYQRGLALQVQPSGYRSYKLIYRHRNRPRWYTIGAENAIALADARRIAAGLMLEVIRGKDPAAEKRAQRNAGTFALLHNHYLEQHAKKRNKSWQEAAALIRRHVLPHWGTLPADSITRALVKAMMRRLDNKPITANETLAAVSAIYSWAIREEILQNASPGELPIAGPTQFTFAVRRSALANLGLTLPPNLPARVNEWLD
jgi:hypothetical protein